MSTVRYFNDIPHIVRYGMHDEENERCWVLFWRNGVKFTIHVDKKDVSTTPFYLQWVPLLRENLEDNRAWLPQWKALCDLVITHAMPLLQQLAPVKPYWVNLSDYLHCPAYTAKLVSSGDSGDSGSVHAEVTAGPEDKAAYDFQPVLPGSFKNMPEDITRFVSSDLVVIDQAESWTSPPSKVRTPQGQICLFKGCTRSSRHVETGIVVNRSLASIEVYLRMLKYSQDSSNVMPVKLPRVFGIVTDASMPTPDRLLAGTRQTEHTQDNIVDVEFQDESDTSESLIAGILLSWSPDDKKLVNFIEQAENARTAAMIRQCQHWRAQLEDSLPYLHSAGIYWGGRDDWFTINQYSVLIDAEGNASFDIDAATCIDNTMSESSGSDAIRGMEMDRRAVEALFNDWLPAEISKRT